MSTVIFSACSSSFLLALLSLGCQFAIATGIGGIFYSTFSQLLLSVVVVVVVVVSLVPDCSHISTNTFHRYLAPQRRRLLSRTASSFLMPTRCRPLAVSQPDLWHARRRDTTHTHTHIHSHAQRQMAVGHWAKMKTLLTGSALKKSFTRQKRHFEISNICRVFFVNLH